MMRKFYPTEILWGIAIILTFLLVTLAIKMPSENERMAARGYSQVFYKVPGGYVTSSWVLSNSTNADVLLSGRYMPDDTPKK